MDAGALDRRISILRTTPTDDGYSSRPGPYVAIGDIWAKKSDTSDGERIRSGSIGAEITTRFIVRWSPFSSAISPKDRLTCNSRTYDIIGVKEQGRRDFLEISARARVDG